MADPPTAAVAVSGQDLLLVTKLHVPGPPPGLVPRPRLAQALGEGLARGRMLVCAPGAFDGLVTALINELAADPGPDEVLLVLDDYHLVESGPVHESLAFLRKTCRRGCGCKALPSVSRYPRLLVN